jgi:hypothetical protein
MLMSLCSYAQTNNDAIILLEKIIRDMQSEGQIIYTDRINSDIIKKVETGLNQKIIYGITPETKQNSVELARYEKKHIISQIELYTLPYWTENLFSNSSLIREENLTSYIKKAYQDYSEKLNNPVSSTNDKLMLIKNYRTPSVFEFSMPIYLRDNTLCFVFMSSRCGAPCGYNEFAFYKRENNTWKKWVVMNADAF